MSSKIDSRIERIRSVFVDLKERLVREQAQNATLGQELNKMNDEMQNIMFQKTKLEQQLETLQKASSSNLQEVDSSPIGTVFRRDDEIDALVKEIELCIRKLKDKHV
jgi:chaperonin cofactor prefoldin